MEYKLNINQYSNGDEVFILENFNKQKNVYYRMHLRDGIEEIYKDKTATNEIKTKINGLNNTYKVVPFGYDGRLSNYIVKIIRIPNTDNKLTYRFMEIFEIIDQYHMAVSYNDDNDNNNIYDENSDSISGDEENSVVSHPRARKRACDLESYISIKTMSKFYSNDN
jgi:hypothetical protein